MQWHILSGPMAVCDQGHGTDRQAALRIPLELGPPSVMNSKGPIISIHCLPFQAGMVYYYSPHTHHDCTCGTYCIHIQVIHVHQCDTAPSPK